MNKVSIEVTLDGTALDAAERELILAALHLTNGSTAQSARLLGCSVRNVQYKLQQMGRRSSEFRIAPQHLAQSAE